MVWMETKNSNGMRGVREECRHTEIIEIGSVLKPHVSYFILVFWPMSKGWFWLRTERPCMLTWQQLIKQNIWTSYSTQGDQNWDSNLTRKGCFGVIDYFMPAASLNWRTRLGLSDPFISSIYSKCNTIFFFKLKQSSPFIFQFWKLCPSFTVHGSYLP